MARTRIGDLEESTVDIDDLAYWINERHMIYERRFLRGEDKPWTRDQILQTYKFTNAFRELDRGTIALRKMLEGHENDSTEDYVFNVCWYRLFNLDIHAEELGWCTDIIKLQDYLHDRKDNGKKVFTSAHMTTACGQVTDKVDLYIDALHGYHLYIPDIVKAMETNTIRQVFRKVCKLYLMGTFMSYEVVCDLRFSPFMNDPSDRFTWANTGPGALRGLKRLGYPHGRGWEALDSMVGVYEAIPQYLEEHVLKHVPIVGQDVVWPPFELREIEHSLCEFDKYQRVKQGEGRPRQKYDGI